MNVATPKVIVIDDDASVRRSLARLLKTEGHSVECFVSAEAYLMEVEPSGEAACLVLDINMPGLNGLDFQQVQLERGCGDQIIFITGHGDVPMCARAMKAGAVDFLPKPFSDAELLEAVDRALHRARLHNEARLRLSALTAREMEVFRHLISGKLNKQIAADLGTAEKTVKLQRGSLTAKLGVAAVADLVRLAQQAGVSPI
jgi:FixJ family two-component response regulator